MKIAELLRGRTSDVVKIGPDRNIAEAAAALPLEEDQDMTLSDEESRK